MSLRIVENEREIEIEFFGPNGKELSKIFNESFLSCAHHFAKEKGRGQSLAIIRFPAGTINSRKAMISPYLPQLIS